MTGTLAEVDGGELYRRLAGPGLLLTIPPVTVRVFSPLPAVAQGLAAMYPDYPVPESAFADFHLRLRRPGGLRRWLRPQVLFEFDGLIPFWPLPLAQAYPMFEWALNWCVSNHLHQYLILHGAVLERAGRALLLPGEPGAGKSTLAAALMLEGWRLLSDEQILIRADGAIQPAPRPVALKNASIGVVRRRWPAAVLGTVAHDTRKGDITHLRPSPASVRQARQCPPPALVAFPRYAPGTALDTRPVGRGETLTRLAGYAFNYHLLRREGFERLATLVSACDCQELHYADLDAALAWLERRLEAGAP